MANTVKLAVVGSRNFPLKYLVERVVYELPNNVELTSGGARGVDTWAEQTAIHHNKKIIVHRANWKRHGKMAGFIRNNLIVRDSDIVLAFWDGKSRGTRHTIQLARYLNKPCIVVKVHNNDS